MYNEWVNTPSKSINLVEESSWRSGLSAGLRHRSEFELQSRYCVHIRIDTPGEKYEPHYPPNYELNSPKGVRTR